MYIDNFLLFDPAATAITSTAVSTNVLDLLAARDLGAGRQPNHVLVTVGTTFTAAANTATLNIQFQCAPDNGLGAPGGYTTIVESSPIPLGQLVAGTKAVQFNVPSISEGAAPPVNTTGTYSSASTAVTVASGTGIFPGVYVNGPGIVPGTTVSAITGTAVTLSQNTTASGAGSAMSFTVPYPIPRFYRLNYVVAGGPMTAGTVMSVIANADELVSYRPGVAVPN